MRGANTCEFRAIRARIRFDSLVPAIVLCMLGCGTEEGEQTECKGPPTVDSAITDPPVGTTLCTAPVDAVPVNAVLTGDRCEDVLATLHHNGDPNGVQDEFDEHSEYSAGPAAFLDVLEFAWYVPSDLPAGYHTLRFVAGYRSARDPLTWRVIDPSAVTVLNWRFVIDVPCSD